MTDTMTPEQRRRCMAHVLHSDFARTIFAHRKPKGFA